MSLPSNSKEETCLLVLDDLRRLYDHINNNWLNLKNRVLTVAFGEVAIATFIFSQDYELDKFTSAETVFFFVGSGLLVGSFLALVWVIATSDWVIPLDVPESKKLYQNYHNKLEYIEYIKSDYESCVEFCLKKMELRSKIFNKVLVSLSAGIIIMLVLKFTR